LRAELLPLAEYRLTEIRGDQTAAHYKFFLDKCLGELAPFEKCSGTLGRLPIPIQLPARDPRLMSNLAGMLQLGAGEQVPDQSFSPHDQVARKLKGAPAGIFCCVANRISFSCHPDEFVLFESCAAVQLVQCRQPTMKAQPGRRKRAMYNVNGDSGSQLPIF
jgi:hypothetical protein